MITGVVNANAEAIIRIVVGDLGKPRVVVDTVHYLSNCDD
jgi:hypothetical protein